MSMNTPAAFGYAVGAICHASLGSRSSNAFGGFFTITYVGETSVTAQQHMVDATNLADETREAPEVYSLKRYEIAGPVAGERKKNCRFYKGACYVKVGCDRGRLVLLPPGVRHVTGTVDNGR